MTQTRPWEIWKHSEPYFDLLKRRSLGLEPEMECAKQLVRLLRPNYRPGMNILDVCCGTGHYLTSLKRLDPDVLYTGIDVTEPYILWAQEHWQSEEGVRFQKGDIYRIPFPDRHFDIVICYNTLQNLPSYEGPLSELLRVTRSHLFVRALISRERRLLSEERLDLKEDEKLLEYHHTYSFSEFQNFIRGQGSFKVEFYEDEIDLDKIDKGGYGTQVQDGKLYLKGILYEWRIMKVTRRGVEGLS